MPKLNLTTRFVDTVKAEKRTEYWDETIRGLTLRVTPTGARSWSIVWTGETDGIKRRLTLGSYPAIDLHAARKRALGELAKISEGADPTTRKRAVRAEMTLEELSDLYVEKYAKPNKRSWQTDERVLAKDVVAIIGAKRKISSIGRRDILDAIDRKIDEGKPIASRQVLAIVSKFFNWAVAEDYLTASPVAGVQQRAKARSRERVLSNAEVRYVWKQIDLASLSAPMRQIVRLLFLTGQRAGEVAGMQRGEVDLTAALWTSPGARTKNGREHAVPLSPAALAIVKAAIATMGAKADDPASPLFCKIKTAITSNAVAHAVRDKLQLKEGPDWTPHDARRTMATRMAEDLNVDPHHIEAVLNHITGHRSGVAGTYNRSTYLVAKRRALVLWAEHLDTNVSGKKAIVVPLVAETGV
ncbi:tyrosine-type recombinase/integrase [Aurantimonas endophytica]|uniref:Integrase n=1 Tax=Aurantimonas endophytica TaxID=1522175 RepID=A0A7W6HDS7_9HYPH|nr:site-specific integrase [Aurantimonas endophytica]MBB4003166.1 integrase [Aurantimonas endophytica]MCO6404037.1 tyrosine-type recombinase/integrase [Aurantimonas endophytica]